MTGEVRNVIGMVAMAGAEMSIRMGVDMTDRMTVAETVLVIGETSVITRNTKGTLKATILMATGSKMMMD